MKMEALPDGLPPTFVSRVNVTSGCWLWTGSLFKSGGYGQFCTGRPARSQRAHRFIYEHVHGSIPPEGIIGHHCDVPACVRPSHLFLTTHAGNVADRVAKGRTRTGHLYGTAHPRSKLTPADVEEIRRLYRPGNPHHQCRTGIRKQLAQRYGILEGTVWRIASGRGYNLP